MKKVLVLVGPTAVGKTAFSIALAKRFDCEIISGDSIQAYRGLDIGSGKITEAEKQGVPHYNIDTLDPGKNKRRGFSAHSPCDDRYDQRPGPAADDRRWYRLVYQSGVVRLSVAPEDPRAQRMSRQLGLAMKPSCTPG